jgi:hypothetical protein
MTTTKHGMIGWVRKAIGRLTGARHPVVHRGVANGVLRLLPADMPPGMAYRVYLIGFVRIIPEVVASPPPGREFCVTARRWPVA